MYNISLKRGSKWVKISTHDSRSEALDIAADLLQSGNKVLINKV